MAPAVFLDADCVMTSNDEGPMGKPASENGTAVSAGKRGFDLEERTARFREQVIRFCRALPKNVITEPLIRQIVRSSTSVGANYGEADDSISSKEFRQKIGTCKKESRETKHWLRMIAAAEPDFATQARDLWKESHELHLIFATIYRKVSTKQQKPK